MMCYLAFLDVPGAFVAHHDLTIVADNSQFKALAFDRKIGCATVFALWIVSYHGTQERSDEARIHRWLSLGAGSLRRLAFSILRAICELAHRFHKALQFLFGITIQIAANHFVDITGRNAE